MPISNILIALAREIRNGPCFLSNIFLDSRDASDWNRVNVSRLMVGVNPHVPVFSVAPDYRDSSTRDLYKMTLFVTQTSLLIKCYHSLLSLDSVLPF